MNQRLSMMRALGVLWQYRARLKESVLLDIRQRYAGSVLGLAWAILYPLMLLCIYSMLYLQIFKVRAPGLEPEQYVVLIFAGLVPLLAFNEALMNATSSLMSNKSLLLSTVFPAELICVRAVLAAQIPSMCAMLITLIIGYSLGYTHWHALVYVPLMWVWLMMFTCGIGWILSLLVLVVRDIQQALGLILMLLTILSPFAYTPEMVPPAMKAILIFNPLSYFVLTFQQLICYGTWPDPKTMGMSILLGFVVFFFGFYLFRRTKHVFFDYA